MKVNLCPNRCVVRRLAKKYAQWSTRLLLLLRLPSATNHKIKTKQWYEIRFLIHLFTAFAVKVFVAHTYFTLKDMELWHKKIWRKALCPQSIIETTGMVLFCDGLNYWRRWNCSNESGSFAANPFPKFQESENYKFAAIHNQKTQLSELWSLWIPKSDISCRVCGTFLILPVPLALAGEGGRASFLLPVHMTWAILYIYRILHGGAKIWILFSSGKNNILRTSASRVNKILFLPREK